MRKNKKNKKNLRNDIRIDNINSNLLRQFDLKGSSRKVGKPNLLNRITANPSTLLYICLIFGASIGIGSAFADKEILPTEKPLDQPIRQQVESKEIPKEDMQLEVPPQEPKQELPIEKPSSIVNDEKQNVQERNNKEALKENDDVIDRKENKNQSPSGLSEKTVDLNKNKNHVPHSFRTEAGGVLPDTAGNDLDWLCFGLFLSVLGVYFVDRRWMEFT